MAFSRRARTSATGTMGVTVWLVFLFILVATWANARELMTSSFSSGEAMISDVSVLQLNEQESDGEVARNKNVCTMCEEFAEEAIKYLEENKTQKEIIDTLHLTCSQLLPFEQQCTTLVNYYVPFLFQEIGSVQPGDFCRQVNLCEQRVITSQLLSEDKCEICHQAVAEILLELKDPDRQLDIIELFLKACDAVERYLKKCKTLVLEYGPAILANAEQFLETTDICTAIHACDFPSAGSNQPLPI